MACVSLAGLPAGFRSARARWTPPFFLIVSQLLDSPASGQRAEENAVTQASDAFGTAVGSQSIGLYGPGNARGFSPADAENLRIEGLYFDEQTGIDPYLFTGSDMRVGIAAQSYAFPSPTGIADLKLRTPGDSAHASLVLQRGPLKQFSGEIDTTYPLAKSVSVGLNVADIQNFDYSYAVPSSRQAVSLIIRFHPHPDAELVPFVGYMHGSEQPAPPAVFSDRIHPVALFDTTRLPTQGWTRSGWTQVTAGIITKLTIADHWSVRAGLFRSVENDPQIVSDLLLGLMPNGTAAHLLDASPARTSSSYSGDFRVTRSWSYPTHKRDLIFAVRGRDVARHYGGDAVADLGTISILHNAIVPMPRLLFSDLSLDRVRQTGIGMNYSERWDGRTSVGLGVLVTDYKRQLSTRDLPTTTEHQKATLPTASFTVNPFKAITIYGSYTRGIEDSVPAPVVAVNRGEPPPATPTWQIDGGASVKLGPHLQLLLGVFKIRKSYFNLDAASRYVQLGGISTEGIESSATLSGLKGLTIVAGGVWLRPEVSRQIPETGGDGNVPVGPVPRTINVNIDYAPSGWRGWGATLQWTSLSSRVETSNDLYSLPPLATLNLGVRYSFKLFDRHCSTRLDISNVTNETGLTLSNNYVAGPLLRRNFMLTFAADM